MRGRIIILSIMIVGLSTIIFFAVRSRQAPSAPPPVDETAGTEEKIEPEVRLLLDEMVISPVLSFSGSSVWFMTRDGKLYSHPFEGGEKEEFVLPEPVAHPARVLWQKAGSGFLIEQNIAGHVRYQYYDPGSHSLTPYPALLRVPRFTESDREVVYIWANISGDFELTVADNNLKNYRKIAVLQRADYQLAASPAKAEVVVFADNLVDPGELLLIDLATGEQRRLGAKAAYEGVKYSPDGKKLLVSRRRADGNGELLLLDIERQTEVKLDAAVFINSLAWQADSTGFFAATSAGLVNYAVADGRAVRIYDSAGFAAENLLLHPTASGVVYTDPSSGKLYLLKY